MPVRPRTGVFCGVALVAGLIMICAIVSFSLPLFSYDCGYLLEQKFPASDFYVYKVVVTTWQDVADQVDPNIPLAKDTVAYTYDDDRLSVWPIVWNERNRFAGNFAFTIISFVLSLFTVILSTIPCAGKATGVFIRLFAVIGILLSVFMFGASGLVAQSQSYDVGTGGTQICSEFAYGSVRHPRGAMVAQALGGVLGMVMVVTALSPYLWRWARVEETILPLYRASHFNMKGN